jgi:hypothetical protein
MGPSDARLVGAASSSCELSGADRAGIENPFEWRLASVWGRLGYLQPEVRGGW